MYREERYYLSPGTGESGKMNNSMYALMDLT